MLVLSRQLLPSIVSFAAFKLDPHFRTFSSISSSLTLASCLAAAFATAYFLHLFSSSLIFSICAKFALYLACMFLISVTNLGEMLNFMTPPTSKISS